MSGAISFDAQRLSASGARVALIATRFNDDIVERLVAGAREALRVSGARDADVHVIHVPGAFELPLACLWAAKSGQYDGVVAFGVVIRGDTAHFEYVAGECTRGIGAVMRETGVPVGFGVLTVENEAQALARAGGSEGNKGAEAALTVVEMLKVRREIEERRP